MRFANFKKSTVRASFKLETLLLTESAAVQHCFRAYHQLEQWLGNKQEATKWDWRKSNVGLQCMLSEDSLIPSELIKKISCRCETGCKKSTCSCRKYGLYCTNLCGGCYGESCTNVEQFIVNDDDETFFDNIDTFNFTENNDKIDDDKTDDDSQIEVDEE